MTKFWKILVIILLVLNAANFPFHIMSLFDRREIRQQGEATEKTIELRAKFGQIIIKRAWSGLAPGEKTFIREHWIEAGYEPDPEILGY